LEHIDDTIKEKCNAIDNLTDSDNKDEENEDFNYDRGNYIV